MRIFLLLFIFLSLFLASCSQIRDSAGVNRKNIDEFKVVENPPLVIPPNFNLLPPEQLSEKNINDAEGELAKEILFGLAGVSMIAWAGVIGLWHTYMFPRFFKEDSNRINSASRCYYHQRGEYCYN